MKAIAGAFLALGLTGGALSGADYGQPEKYRKGAAIEYPDCSVVYKGERRVSSDLYPRGFLYDDFTVSAKGQKKEVSWSAGTGEIGPTFFNVGGKEFVLELRASVASEGWLPSDRLVLWLKPDYEKALAGRNRR